MPQTKTVNRRVVLNARPIGAPKPSDFRLEETAIPETRAGEVLLRNLSLSLDPYMRGRMSEGPSYAPPVAIGNVMVGATVARVEHAGNSNLKSGDLVLGFGGWQDYFISDSSGLTRLPPQMTQPSLSLGILGMPGLTAYVGLLDIGQPKKGETVVVAAATGAVGSAVGQIAKLQGCRVVAIAGGPDKCRYAVDELKFDACLDHYLPELPERLNVACPAGIDIYFESVGGAVFDAVLPLLNDHARVPVCGLISQYNATKSAAGPDKSGVLLRALLTRRIKMHGFIVRDHFDRQSAFFTQMSEWVKQGTIKFREDFVDGIENAPDAFIGLLHGKNFGKLVVRIASE